MISLPPSKIIEASAGTGKTHALAERLVALLEAGVEPQRIVALTFSRAAAGEIFERFVKMLADKSSGDAKYVALLRKVVSSQHLSMIGTLDSFLLKIVRLFPLELGLESAMEIMPDFVASTQAAKTSFAILRRTDEASKKIFAEAFYRAVDGQNVRSFVASFRSFVSAWHEACLEYDDDASWGDPSRIWQDGELCLAGAASLAAAADAMLVFRQDDEEWRKLAATVRSFRGSFGVPKGYLKKLLELDLVPRAGPIAIEFRRKSLVFSGAEGDALRKAIGMMFSYVLRQKLDLAKGVRRLIAEYEKEYDRRVRRKGRLVFSDVPRLVSKLDDDVRKSLEYRMDSRIDAWALDEFQDTSREQWRALANLIDESVQSAGSKSVFIVGDRKQAIYGWRNGDVGIFQREIESGKYVTDSLVKSFRFGPAIADAVNRVFADGLLGRDFPDWTCPKHEVKYENRNGFVQKVEAGSYSMESFADAAYNALKAVDPVRRSISAAILVRSNALGEYLATELKRRGIDGVVWEGESRMMDTPAMNAFLDLAVLSDHPGDVKSYRHFATTPLARAKYPQGVPSAETLSLEMAQEFAAKGLVRVLRELRALLPKDSEEAWSVAVEERFEAMLHAACEFESQRDSSTSLADFREFLLSRKRRALAQKGKVKVMTIHRSKGLAFDYVVLPLYERSAIEGAADAPLAGDGWILPDPGDVVARNVPALASAAQARNRRSWLEKLCVYYVAMTRAKRSMTIILSPPSKDSWRFSDYVRQSLPDEIGDREWQFKFKPEDDGSGQEGTASGWMNGFARGPRVKMSRSLPSLQFRSGMSAGEFFAPDPKRKSAIERGVDIHERLAAIEWWTEAPGELAEPFTKPEGFVELWREKPYEMFVDGTWESGVFDRVVITEGGARIYDFKRTRPRRGESEADFKARLDSVYSRQLESYRRAVSALTGIGLDRIGAKIVVVGDWLLPASPSELADGVR